MTDKPQIGLVLRTALLVSGMLGPLARPHLKRRLAKGKEDPDRWREKLGETDAKRPDGPLVWMHGVGVGEVMALRGLIDQMLQARPDLNFLVTSSARSSGDVFARNLPPRTQHQYLPLDVPGPVKRFLTHWRPDLAVWSDQEIWPRLAVTLARRNIPQVYIAARITEKSAKAKLRFGSAYGDLYRLMALRHAQDPTTKAALLGLMNDDSPVHVTGSIKAAAAPLAANADLRAAFEQVARARKIWVLAPSHPADEQFALSAHKILCTTDPQALLIIVPRDVARAPDMADAVRRMGFSVQRRSEAARPDADTNVYIADTYGELGTWYTVAPIALIGGTFDATEGHNPWEAIALDCAVLHGDYVANFAKDYEYLGYSNGARHVRTADDIVKALHDPAMLAVGERAAKLRDDVTKGINRTTDALLALLER